MIDVEINITLPSVRIHNEYKQIKYFSVTDPNDAQWTDKVNEYFQNKLDNGDTYLSVSKVFPKHFDTLCQDCHQTKLSVG